MGDAVVLLVVIQQNFEMGHGQWIHRITRGTGTTVSYVRSFLFCFAWLKAPSPLGANALPISLPSIAP